MSENNDYCIAMTTTNDEALASSLAEKIVTNRLAACIQIQQIKSVYMWKHDICKDIEYLLMIKTKVELYDALTTFIKQNHTYEIPELIQIPIVSGDPDFLNWIDDSTLSLKQLD